MHDYEIRKLSYELYKAYPQDQYKEILRKDGRSYDVVLFEIDYLADYYVCVPFRTEMKHIMGISLNFSPEVKNINLDLIFLNLLLLQTVILLEKTLPLIVMNILNLQNRKIKFIRN